MVKIIIEKRKENNILDKIDKEKFIRDIKKDLGIKEKQYYNNSNGEQFDGFDNIDDLGEIFEEFFKNSRTENVMDNPNNIYVTCKIKKDEAIKGCKKDIRIKRKLEDETIKKENIHIQIPNNIKNEQQIILRGEGNRNNGIIGNLVVKIIVKQEEK